MKKLSKEEMKKKYAEGQKKLASIAEAERAKLGISFEKRGGKILTRGEGLESKKAMTTGAIDVPEKPPITGKAKPGPSTQDLDGDRKLKPLGDLAYLLRHATPEDFKGFRKTIEKRVEKAGGEWRVLPGGLKIPGDSILFGCRACKKWFWAKVGIEHCPRCGQWKLFKATKKQEAEWFKSEEKKIEDRKAGEPERQRKTREFNEQMFARERDDKQDLSFTLAGKK